MKQQLEILPPRASKRTQLTEVLPVTDRFLRIEEVEPLTSMSRATIYRLVAAQRFPAAIPIARKRVAWSQAQIAAWQRRMREASSTT